MCSMVLPSSYLHSVVLASWKHSVFVLYGFPTSSKFLSMVKQNALTSCHTRSNTTVLVTSGLSADVGADILPSRSLRASPLVRRMFTVTGIFVSELAFRYRCTFTQYSPAGMPRVL